MLRVLLDSTWPGGILHWQFQPADSAYLNTVGLAGYWDGNSGNDLFILQNTIVNETKVTTMVPASVNTLSQFWR